MTKIEDDALADAYNEALALEKSGDIDAAVMAYAQVLKLDPDDHGGAAVRLAALGRGDIPQKAPAAYVETLFDQHAEIFEDILVDQLGYGVPGMIAQRLQALGLGPFERMLDLGCGTGLAAEAMGAQVAEKIGLDIAENMVEIAHDKEIYESLYVAEAEDFLADNDEPVFDLIVAADVLPYLGALDALFSGAAANMSKGGVLVFSSETQPIEVMGDAPFMVTPHQRFAHSETYVRAQMAAAGFEVVEVSEINVRMQDEEPTPGHLVVGRK